MTYDPNPRVEVALDPTMPASQPESDRSTPSQGGDRLSRQRTRLVGLFPILGAAVGFTVGLITIDLAGAALLGSVGAGLGVVIGAIADLTSDGKSRKGQRA